MSREFLLNSARQKLSRHQLPPVLYRFDRLIEHGDAILAGDVWVTTLEHCRATEDSVRGDPDEGKELYSSGTISGDSDEPDMQKVLSRMAPHIGGPPARDLFFSNNVIETVLPNAFVYCTTLRYDPVAMKGFGASCIRISDPREFYYQMTAALLVDGQKHSSSSALPFLTVNAKPVSYVANSYSGLEDPPGPIGFVKSPDKYFEEKEFRFLWRPQVWPCSIEPHLLVDAIDPKLVERVRN